MKNNKGFTSVALILIIIGVLIIAGGAYFFGKNSSKVVSNVVENNLPEENQVVDDIQTQINLDAGYQINYPTDWTVVNSDITMSADGYNSFAIKNKKDTTLPGANSELRAGDSYIEIAVNKNMNYSNYEEFIKDPKYLSPKLAEERMANIQMINIGGKTLQAFTGINVPASTTTGRLYSFIYNKILYSISMASGSEEQFNKDKPIFDNLVSSFKFLDTDKIVCNVDYETTAESKVASEQSYTLITGFEKKCDGNYYFTFDYLGPGTGQPESGNGSYYSNTNFKLRTFKVDSSLMVKTAQNGEEVPVSSYVATLKKIGFTVFSQNNAYIRNAPGGQPVFNITIQNGVVKTMNEVYLP